MRPEVSTVNNDTPILSDREFLEELAGYVEGLAIQMDGLAADADTTRKQLDHLDYMLHEVWQFIEEHKPALARALAFMEPGQTIRDYFKRSRGRDAVPQDGQGQVQ